MLRLNVPAFEEYCLRLKIPSRDEGLVPFRFWGTQRHLVESLAAGLERDVHEFVVLKGGRQIGGSTTMDALTLWVENEIGGTQGMVVSDDDDNADYRRDIILEMQASLPVEWRWGTPINNKGMLRWQNGSRLSFKAAGVRARSSLGRSRGLNFLHADEVGAWRLMTAVSALRASLSKRNPNRCYVWNSTAQGIGTPFHDMWKAAEHVPTQQHIFLAWWMHELYRLAEPDAASSELVKDLWAQYTRRRPDADERAWMTAVKKRYGASISVAQLGWYRHVLEAEMNGDEAMRAQEYSCLPEDAFQAFGDKIIRPELIRAMRAAPKPKPDGFRYDFGRTLDPSLEGTQVKPCPLPDASLLVWEQPQPQGVYVIAGHPARSSSPNASEFIAQAWRAYPDQLVQAAEYRGDSTMYQFAWTLLHLAGAYRGALPPYFIMEIGGPGYRVLEEIHLIERYGYGLSAAGSRQNLRDVLGSVQHYFYHRPDLVQSRPSAIEWRTQASNRAWLLHGIRDSVERHAMVIRSVALIEELAAVRRGESGDQDQIEGGGGMSDAGVISAAMAVECWLHSAMPDLLVAVKPKDVPDRAPRHPAERLVQSYLGDILLPRR